MSQRYERSVREAREYQPMYKQREYPARDYSIHTMRDSRYNQRPQTAASVRDNRDSREFRDFRDATNPVASNTPHSATQRHSDRIPYESHAHFEPRILSTRPFPSAKANSASGRISSRLENRQLDDDAALHSSSSRYAKPHEPAATMNSPYSSRAVPYNEPNQLEDSYLLGQQPFHSSRTYERRAMPSRGDRQTYDRKTYDRQAERPGTSYEEHGYHRDYSSERSNARERTALSRQDTIRGIEASAETGSPRFRALASQRQPWKTSSMSNIGQQYQYHASLRHRPTESPVPSESKALPAAFKEHSKQAETLISSRSASPVKPPQSSQPVSRATSPTHPKPNPTRSSSPVHPDDLAIAMQGLLKSSKFVRLKEVVQEMQEILKESQQGLDKHNCDLIKQKLSLQSRCIQGLEILANKPKPV